MMEYRAEPSIKGVVTTYIIKSLKSSIAAGKGFTKGCGPQEGLCGRLIILPGNKN